MVTDREPYGGEDAFKIWVCQRSLDGRHMGLRGAVIKQGRDVMKTVMLANFGDETTGEVRKRELRFRTHERRRGETGWDFDEPDPKTTWYCENEEIERLLSFLHSDVSRTGRFRVVDTESPSGVVLSLLRCGDLDSQAFAQALVQHGDMEELASSLAASNAGLSAAQSAVIAGRRDLIAKLQSLIQAAATTETDVQRLIGTAHWVFGGRYVGVDKRNLMSLDQHDIVLLGADGTLHIVELKGPNIPTLVRPHRNHWIVGHEIHEAVGQAMNYVRTFDELGASQTTYYQNELGQEYDMRRVFATVVIGHPKHVRAAGKGHRVADERTIQQTIRSYNAHLSRIEVVTYKDLADTAERALAFEDEAMLASLPEDHVSEHPEEPEAPGAEPWTVGDDPWQADPWAPEIPF
jgi:hypothetical protein